MRGANTSVIVDADLDDPVRVVASFDLREGADPAYLEVPIGREFAGDFDGDGDVDLALARPYGVAFYGVDPALLEDASAPVPSTLLGGCGAGGPVSVGLVGVGLFGGFGARRSRLRSGPRRS